MDNLTHSLVGLRLQSRVRKVIARAPLLLIAASLPDSDIVTLIFGGRWNPKNITAH